MKVMTAYGAAEIGNWVERLERDVAQGHERTKDSRRQHGGLHTCAAAGAQAGSPGTSLLSLQTEMRQDAKKEFWIIAVLWAVSWGAVSLLCV